MAASSSGSSARPSWGVDQVTMEVRLLGAGTDEVDEDMSPASNGEHDAPPHRGPSLQLPGDWTLAVVGVSA